MRYLYYHGEVSEAGARNVEVLLNLAVSGGEKEVCLCLSSGGGNVNAGIGLINFMKMLPIEVNTHASGICGSIAASILVAGVRRTAAPLSVFMTHVATYLDGPMAGQPATYTGLVSAPFKNIGWTDEAIAERFGPYEYPFTPQQALEWGVVHDVIDLAIGPDDLVQTVRLP